MPARRHGHLRRAGRGTSWEDYTYWLAADQATLKRINRLTDDALRDPAAGIGKPEPLRHMLAGPGPGGWARDIAWSTWSTAMTS